MELRLSCTNPTSLTKPHTLPSYKFNIFIMERPNVYFGTDVHRGPYLMLKHKTNNICGYKLWVGFSYVLRFLEFLICTVWIIKEKCSNCLYSICYWEIGLDIFPVIWFVHGDSLLIVPWFFLKPYMRRFVDLRYLLQSFYFILSFVWWYIYRSFLAIPKLDCFMSTKVAV